jgi:hypothetical protein
MCRYVVVLCFTLTLISGCVPFIVPPARITVGPTLRRGNYEDEASTSDNNRLVSFRGGIYPMGAMKDGDRRLLDVGFGYTVEGSTQNQKPNDVKVATLHGPYLEINAYPLRAPIGKDYGLRAGMSSSIDALFRDGNSRSNIGFSFGPVLEFTGNVTGPFSSETDDGFSAGSASGYWAFGIFGNASLRKLDEHNGRAYTAGLSIRIPFAIGIACCAVPDVGSNDHSSNSSSSHPTRKRANPQPAK